MDAPSENSEGLLGIEVPHDWIYRLQMSCTIISILVLLIIFVAYTVIPKVRNFHGMILRSYVVTLILTYISYALIMLIPYYDSSIFWIKFFGTIGIYCSMSSPLWLSVVSFDIWRTFRDLRPNQCRNDNHKTKRFIWSAIFAWISPAVPLAPVVFFIHCDPAYDGNDNNGMIPTIVLIPVGFIIIVLISIICLYALTICSIRRHKKRMADMTNDANNRHSVDTKWVNVQIKLFLVMTGHIGIEIAIFLVLLGLINIESFRLTFWLELLSGPMIMLECIFIFVILLWNDNVKRWIREKLITALHDFCYCFENI